MKQRTQALNMMIVSLLVVLPFQNCGRGYASFATASTPNSSSTPTPSPEPSATPIPPSTPAPSPSPTKPTWSTMAVAGAPAPRAGAFMIWTGSRILVYGGYRYDAQGIISYFNDGGLFDPKTNSWTAMSMAGAPTVRYGTTPIWTGSRLLIWGGHRYFGPNSIATVGDGAMFDPETNSWSAISQTGAPSARSTQAVWTGSRLLIFGGARYNVTNYTYLNDGASFDPIANSWTPISMVGAPSPRSAAVILWTGSKLLAWGGYNGSQSLNDGGVYDPATNSWTMMTIADAPSARQRPNAVWTGTQLVIAGGTDFSGKSLSTGAAFDPLLNKWSPLPGLEYLGPSTEMFTEVYKGMPLFFAGFTVTSTAAAIYSSKGAFFSSALNSWLPISTVNAPAGRRGASHTEIGIGKFVVFGGYDSAPRNDGSIYDPALDKWSALPMEGSPRARSYHSAVFTGEQVIIFGGIIRQEVGTPLEFTNEGAILSWR